MEASSAQSKPELEKLQASSVGWDGFCSHTINSLKPQRFIPGLAQSHRDCTSLCAAGLPARGEPGPGCRNQRSPWQAAVTDTSHHPAQHHSGDAASIKRNISTNPAHARASRGSASFRGSVKQHQPAGARLQVGRNKPGAFFFFFFLLKKGRTCGRHLFRNSAPVLGGIWPDPAGQALLPQSHIRRAVSTECPHHDHAWPLRTLCCSQGHVSRDATTKPSPGTGCSHCAGVAEPPGGTRGCCRSPHAAGTLRPCLDPVPLPSGEQLVQEPQGSCNSN